MSTSTALTALAATWLAAVVLAERPRISPLGWYSSLGLAVLAAAARCMGI